MDRLKSIIERIESELKTEGHIKKEIWTKSATGYGDPRSYFDLLVDLKLDGKKDLTMEELWENMKMQLNEKDSLIAHADKEYRKLQNSYRGLLQDHEELIKSNSKKKLE